MSNKKYYRYKEKAPKDYYRRLGDKMKGFLGFFGFGRKVRKLRKKWDRLREKALKKEQPLKGDILLKMDQIEQNLRILEERKVSRMERSRLSKEIEIDLEEIKAMVKMKEEEYVAQKQATYSQRATPSQQKFQTRPR